MGFPADRRRQMVARRRRVLAVLALVVLAGLRLWAVFGGRWWLAPAVSGTLLFGYLLALAVTGHRAYRRRRRRLPRPAAAHGANPASAAPTIAASVPAEALPPPGPPQRRAPRGRLLRRPRPAAPAK